jgi:hypothetical protein
MSDRIRTRRGVVALAGALSAFAVVPVAADSQIPGTDVLKGAPAVPNVLERAGNQLEAVKRGALTPHRSDPGSTQTTAPRQSAPAASSAPRRSATSNAGVQRRVTTAATGNHAGGAASTGSNSRAASSRTATSSQARASDATPAARGATRPTVVSPGSHVQNDPSLPFTGSRPLNILALGLVAFAVGLAARWTLRRRVHARA